MLVVMLWLLLPSVLICYYVVSAVVTYRKLRQFKGPFLASFSGLWILKGTLKRRLYLDTKEALEKYGSPVRIGPNMLMTDDPALIRGMSALQSGFNRGTFFGMMKLDKNVENVLSERDWGRQSKLRAKVIQGYHGKEIPTMEADIDNVVMDLVKLIKRDYTGKVMDFANLAQFFAMDVLTQLAFGKPWGYLTRNEDIYDYLKTTGDYYPVMELGCNFELFQSILTSDFMAKLAGPKPEDRAGMGAVIGVAQKGVAERFKSPDPKAKRDMLDSFIAHGLSQKEAEGETLIQIMAGADSTATVIRVTFLYLLTNPPVYAKLLAEINAFAAQGKISYPVISESEAKKMPYLQACIMEGLRVWQPLLGLADKISPPGGATINGVHIPGGVHVGQNLFSMMRRKDIFGPDADVYRPERYIEADKETRYRYDRMFDMCFGTGRAPCLGKNVALMELSKIFVELIRNYDWGIVDPIHPMSTSCNAIHTQRKMYLRAWPRQQPSV